MTDLSQTRPLEYLPFGAAIRFFRIVAFTFPAANTDTEVLHQTGEVPHGCWPLSNAGAITRVPGQAWTKTLAYLRSTVAHDETILCFVVLKEEPINVNP